VSESESVYLYTRLHGNLNIALVFGLLFLPSFRLQYFEFSGD
jgi:hypothetical protein